MTNIIQAKFDGSRATKTSPAWKWDYGQELNISGIDGLPSVFEVHFANDGNATTTTQIGTDGVVTIPDTYLTTGKDIHAYIYLHTGLSDGETEYKITIPVKSRPQPTNDTPTPVQQDAITEAIAALNSAVTQTGEDATAAASSADDALAAKNDAVSAKNAAESAKNSAVNAKNAAVTAQNEATTAKEDAVAAKNAAVGSASDASTSASTASTKASEAAASASAASGSAATASTKAGEAAASASAAASSASTATTKAGEAATSATTAATKAGEAATSATSAATAKSGADASALVSEGWAKGTQSGTAVESGTYFHDNAKYYKEQAEAVAQSIPEDYSELSANVLKAFPTDTASGAVASFPDGADGLPVKDLTVSIEPAQSGSGDPSPTNVRPISGWTGVTVSHSGADTSDPETLSISWQTEAGTVYGGSLDVTTGLLTVDREFVTVSYPGTLTAGSRAYCKYKLGKIGYASQAPKAYSSVLKKYSGTASGMPEGAFAVVNSTAYNGSFLYLCFPGCSSSYTSATLSNNKAYLETLVSNGITPQFVFGLSSPLTYQLTPQEVATLLGENNIWADTGDVSVEYRADPTLYINTRLSAIVAMLANVETSLTASRAYSVNDFLTVSGQIYKVTANIASGGTITPGTNVAETTVGAQLFALLNS